MRRLMLRPFFIAAQFLTRFPVPAQHDITPLDLGRSVLYYPMIGLCIGSLLYLSQYLLSGVDAVLQGALLLVIWVMVSGALHLDGLADSADAWLGGYGSREKTLHIMKDPRCGPMGVVVVVLVLLVKYASLVIVIDNDLPVYLIVAPFAGRALIIWLFLTTPYVRADGIGAQHATHIPRTQAKIILVMCMLGLILSQGMMLLLMIMILAYALRHLMRLRLGGTTGDTAGALIEMIEAVALVMLTQG